MDAVNLFGMLPSLLGDSPGSSGNIPPFVHCLARISNRVGHMCHICIWAVVCVSVGIGSEMPFGCSVLILVLWALFCPWLFADEFFFRGLPLPLLIEGAVGGGCGDLTEGIDPEVVG